MSEAPREAPSRVRRVVYRIVYIAVLLVLCGLVLEGGAWYILGAKQGSLIETVYLQDLVNTYDPLLMWRLTPNLADAKQTGPPGPNYWEATVNTDAQGMRVVPGSDPQNPARILAIGDSTVFGVGSNDGEAWPAQLQAVLDAKDSGDWAVLNGGVPGYSIVQGLRFLKARQEAVQPLYVLACFGHNDLVELSAVGGVRDITWRAPEGRSKFLYLLERVLREEDVIGEHPWGTPELRVTLGEFIDTAQAFIDFCREKGITPVFVLWPFVTEAEQDAYMALGKSLRAVCEAEHVACVDLLPAFAPERAAIYIDPVHVNPAGNRLAAEAIYAGLIEAFPASFGPESLSAHPLEDGNG